MHTVIRNYQGAKTLADELKTRSADVERLISTVPGFIAYYLIKTTDGAISVTVCEDRAGCEESTKRAAKYLSEKLPDLKLTAPQIIEGDLLFKFANYKTAV